MDLRVQGNFTKSVEVGGTEPTANEGEDFYIHPPALCAPGKLSLNRHLVFPCRSAGPFKERSHRTSFENCLRSYDVMPIFPGLQLEPCLFV